MIHYGSMQTVDVLVITAHPDDAELNCAGSIFKLLDQGYSVGMVELTRGEMGTRGTADTRREEANAAAKQLGIVFRGNVGLPDGLFRNDVESQLKLMPYIRAARPRVVIGNAPHDRHPDHGRGGQLIEETCFYSGLRKIETKWQCQAQQAHRPKQFLFSIQDRYVAPSLVVDVTAYWPQKLAAIKCYGTQFHKPGSTEPETHISKPDFLDFIEARSRTLGHMIGATHGEGFIMKDPVPVHDIVAQFS